MISYSFAGLADIDKFSRLFFEVLGPKYKEYLNYDLKEKTCRKVSELYIKAGKTILAKDKYRVVGFVSAAFPLFSLWKQGLDNFLPGRFMFMAPVRLGYLFKSFCLAIGVDSAHRKKGIGAKLMQELEKVAKAEGVSEIYTQVYEQNDSMKKLLTKTNWSVAAKCGFTNKVLILKKLL